MFDYVRPEVQRFLDIQSAQGGHPLHELDPVAYRKAHSVWMYLLDVPVGELAVIRDVAFDAAHGVRIPLRVFDARTTRGPGPAVVFYHGGGWITGDLDLYNALCAEIARQLDLPVVSVDYRLAPEHPFPAAPDDCEAATQWVADSPAALGFKVTGLVLAGDSAGGGLAVVTAMALRDKPAAVPVLVQWPIYPVIDFATEWPAYAACNGPVFYGATMRWIEQHYKPDPRDWRASPLIADQTGMPPTLIYEGSVDLWFEQVRAYAAACVGAGVPTVYREAAGNIHGCFTMRKQLPSSERDLRDCIMYLKAMLAEAQRAE